MLPPACVEQFVREGYCAVRIDLARSAAERAIDLTWTHCPDSFDRASPESWRGEVGDSCGVMSMESRRGRLKFRECVRKEPWLRALTAENPAVIAHVETLIGTPLVPEYFRGLYPVFPIDEATEEKALKGHCDRHPFQVGAVLYLSDVERRGGGFTVWPGSHRKMAAACSELSVDRTPRAYTEARRRVHATIQPAEITGPAGTLILWHHRMLHAAGNNTTPAVRHAIFCDFMNAAFARSKGGASRVPFDKTWRVGGGLVSAVGRALGWITGGSA